MPGADGLPFIDEHSVEVAAGPEAAWDAIGDVVERTMSGGLGRRGARILGCADCETTGPRPLAAGSAFPGFRVDDSEPPRRLSLRGSHRFSDYALVFRLDGLGSERTRVRAETRAAFPGPHGSAYRAVVIGLRAHVLATRRLLDGIRRSAERR